MKDILQTSTARWVAARCHYHHVRVSEYSMDPSWLYPWIQVLFNKPALEYRVVFESFTHSCG
ncbi:hypothetical protein DPMN_066959 [Dreissena polymorpha]|uniref:Uncharacterized protein n=1 Tax=Dreissena polymorpha TaxID=45954 RepID=A0A9D3YZX7_DREPO|nr:hypothetical protein DPMN_066959 [Dreissena polymorpha]